jgi:hypothetical protein
MGAPVVISTNGFGVPVRAVEDNAPVLTVAENGYGAPVVLTPNGVPAIVDAGTVGLSYVFRLQ